MKVIESLEDRPLIALFANKSDLEGRTVTSKEGIQLAKKYSIPLYFELASKDKQKVTDTIRKCVKAKRYMEKYNGTEFDVYQMFGEEWLYNQRYLPSLLWQERANWSDIDIL